ncbi:MAG: accessory factor UbiK family protein [Granulosicoccus sp.]
MIDARVFDDISQTLGKLLPPGLADAKEDFERNAKSAVQGALSNLDLVTREEFDVQAEVLNNTRRQLKKLEARIVALEAASEIRTEGNGES